MFLDEILRVIFQLHAIHAYPQDFCIMVFMSLMKGYVLMRFLVADQAIRGPEHDNKPFSLAGVLIEAGSVSVEIIQRELLVGICLKAEKQ